MQQQSFVGLRRKAVPTLPTPYMDLDYMDIQQQMKLNQPARPPMGGGLNPEIIQKMQSYQQFLNNP